MLAMSWHLLSRNTAGHKLDLERLACKFYTFAIMEAFSGEMLFQMDIRNGLWTLGKNTNTGIRSIFFDQMVHRHFNRTTWF